MKHLFTGHELESEVSATSYWNPAIKRRDVAQNAPLLGKIACLPVGRYNSEIGMFYAPDPAKDTY